MSFMRSLTDFLSMEFSCVRDLPNDYVLPSSDLSPHHLSFFDDDRATRRVKQLSSYLVKYMEECDDEGIWDEMAQTGISGKQLSIFLLCAVEQAFIENRAFDNLERSVLSACAYLYLSSIKSSKVYAIFNLDFYQKCLSIFRSLCCHLMSDSRARTSEINTKDDTQGEANKKKVCSGEMTAEEENTMLAASLNRNDIETLLGECTEALFVVLNETVLTSYSSVLQQTAIFVRDLARVDMCADASVNAAQSLQSFKKLRRFCDRSFALMHKITDEGRSDGGYVVMSRIVYPRLAFWTFECDVIPASYNIPVVFSIWRDLMVKFIEARVKLGIASELNLIFKVLDNLYQRCTDRLDYRTRLSHSVIKVLQVLPRNYQYEFVQHINCFSKSEKVSVRNFTCEVVPLFLKILDLSNPEPLCIDSNNSSNGARARMIAPLEPVDELNHQQRYAHTDKYEGSMLNESVSSLIISDENDINCDVKHEETKINSSAEAVIQKNPSYNLPSLYFCMIRCCVDKASSVRIRAMLHLTQLLGISKHRIQLVIHSGILFKESPEIFGCGPKKFEEASESGDAEEDGSPNNSEKIIANAILHIIVAGTNDDTVGVRRNSLMALQAFFPYIEEVDDIKKVIGSLKERCLDSSLMVRKQAAEVLDHLYCTSSKHCDELGDAWLTAVLPLINDREQSVQQLVGGFVTKTILNPILGEMEYKIWRLLHLIELENCNHRLFKRAIMQEYREGRVTSALVDELCIKQDLFPERSGVVWMLLADLSVIFKVDPQKAVQAWYLINDDDQTNKIRHVTRVLTKNCADIDYQTRSDLISDLQRKIENFRIGVSNISSAYLCLVKLLECNGIKENGQELQDFGRRVLEVCYYKLHEALLEIEGTENAKTLTINELTLVRVVVTIGEVIQISPMLLPAGLQHLDTLKMMLALAVSCRSGGETVGLSANLTPGLSRCSSITNFPVNPVFVQGFVEETLNFHNCLTPAVRGHAIVTIAKFCLMDEMIAKATIPVFVKQLKQNPDHVIRNNIAVVVCDLCIRYTLMVDRYIPIIAACLGDVSTLIRLQTLESLTFLIKEQYIRWEGEIAHRFICTLLDEDGQVSEYAKFCLRDVLLLQFPDLLSGQFVEFMLNSNSVSLDHGRNADSEKRTKHTFLLGDRNRGNRMAIYKFMISTFDDTRKFALMAQFCTQILYPLINGAFSYDNENVLALVRDALTIMSLEQMNLAMDVGKGPDEEEGPPSVVVAVAKEIVTKAFCKAMVEYVMPTLLELRTYFREKRSSLSKELYAVFRVICREHKEQMDEFLDGDEQLKAEVEFEIHRFEQLERAQRLAAKRRMEQIHKELLQRSPVLV